MRYLSVIDPSNKNNSHSLTIDFIADAAFGESLDILDVGCSAGYLGEYLRTQGHYVVGIDITPEAITKAIEFLNEAHCMKVEDFFASNRERKFDVVIFGDVLEHVTNAEEVLRLTARALKINGRVVASIPNVSHLAVRAMLLEGRWEYADLGLLDRDHVRFFTKRTIQKLFSEAGFEVAEMRTTNLPVEDVDRLCNMQLNPFYVEAVQKIAGKDPSATVFQYIAMAKPKSDVPRIVCMVPEMTSGLFILRIKAPLENWANRHGGLVHFCILGGHKAEDIIWGDVFVFQRLGGTYTIQLMEFLKAHGKSLVFEIDDLLIDFPDFLAHHRGSLEDRQLLLDAIACANVVTTTTPRLYEKLLKVNSNIVCVPNCISVLPPERIAHQEYMAPVATLLVASSDSVLVNCLIEPLRFIQNKYGEKIRLVIVGPIDSAMERGGLIFERLPILSYSEFTGLLQTLVNPIGLIPLDNSEFSACKSPIKYFDYSAAQIPVICSNVPPYSDYVQDGINGILVNDFAADWINAIEMLIEKTDERIRLSSAARENVKEAHLVDRAGDTWKSVIDLLVIRPREPISSYDVLSLRIHTRFNVSRILKKLIQLRSYKQLSTIYKNEGIVGIKIRLARFFFYH
jgi:O-antigen biosynthesis protein